MQGDGMSEEKIGEWVMRDAGFWESEDADASWQDGKLRVQSDDGADLPAELLARFLREVGWTCEAPGNDAWDRRLAAMPVPMRRACPSEMSGSDIRKAEHVGLDGSVSSVYAVPLSRPIPLVRLCEDDPSMHEVTSGLRSAR